ncbi:FG-GAP repeat domain-containing protein [Candidatus Lokiarchaeum ossiferum]|uniref:FG-GAP repeat domain-containing protein n=1 Tax=Candidatus Lokiarchaeum ossiferum TaxID=2951803 RepID=UPI00352C8250
MKTILKTQMFSIILLGLIMTNTLALIPNTGKENTETQTQEIQEISLDILPDEIKPAVTNLIDEELVQFPSDYDIGKVLADRENEYSEVFEPWKSKAAIHAIAYDEDTGYLALAGGYLYDNEVHLYRLNTETGDFDKVWVCGDGIIQSDVMTIAFGDTDLNNFLEIVAGSSDGHVYVFEQRHIYDPFTNTENMFELVWTSPSMFRVFDVKVEDADRDFRPDIIVGSWEGVYLYEYDEHSGYPFNEEHWITYTQVFHDDVNGEKIYSLESGDTNNNGLPEIIVGTREGTVYVFENAGISMEINEEYFPLIQDNAYQIIWTSENYTWTPILSMDIGELDGTDGDEIALIAQGQGVLTLDWNSITKTYDYKKVVRGYDDWETFGYWGLDNYVDRVVSANNVTYSNPRSPYFETPEPIVYTGEGPFVPDADCYPYNTGMAMAPDANFTTFDASLPGVSNATAIIDFGLDEEGTGSANSEADIIVEFENELDESELYPCLNFSISQDGIDFEQVYSDRFSISAVNETLLYIDIDDALIDRKWDWFRYVKLAIFNDGNYSINSLTLEQVYNLLTDALSLTIGPLKLNGNAYVEGVEEPNKIIVGTVTGKYIGIQWGFGINPPNIVWDSGNDDFHAEGSGIWDIINIASMSTVPIWRDVGYLNGFFPNQLPLISPELYNSWSYGKIDDGAPKYFVGTTDKQLIAYNMLGSEDSTVNGYFNEISSYLASQTETHISVETWKYLKDLPVLPFIAVSSYDPSNIPNGNYWTNPNAQLKFWSRPSSTSLYSEADMKDIYDYDDTGEITSLIALSQTTPKLDFADYDGDNDVDMVFSNGKLYLGEFLLYSDTPAAKFRLKPNYFAQVNEEIPSALWGQPQLVDLNQDGILDLVLNYANKDGSTAFINKGTAENPDWVQDKRIFSNSRPETNLKFQHLTDTRILPTSDGNSYDIWKASLDFEEPDFMMVSFNTETLTTQWAQPVYGASDTYMIATYPEVKRQEFCLLNSEDDSFLNYGFHILNTWNNEDDLEGWTLSITSGDTDGDGKGEIIVGDYDNNVYVFENMVNNTYKRMYRSDDLTHDETSSESPYLYDELEGIDGEFKRKIWDHAEHLIADVDLDQDNLKELIVVSELQIYIFEDKGLTGGDELSLVKIIDLRESEFASEPEWDNVDKITAIATATDLDNNLEHELIVGAGPYLFVYNIPIGTFEEMEDKEYFVTDPKLGGRYNLVGNPAAQEEFPFAVINTIITGDTDEDGYSEIIFGGINDTRAIKQDGFLYIYESQGGTFYQAWEAPTTITTWNPISIIEIDDQDYDTLQEIIIGHSMGVDIWEYIEDSDSNYRKVEHITSSPNYPLIDVNVAGTNNLHLGNPFNPNPIVQRSMHDMVDIPGSDLVFEVFSSMGNINWRLYSTSADSWMDAPYLLPDNSYASGSGTVIYETEPSIHFYSDLTMYACWEAAYSNGNSEIWLSQYNSGWQTPISILGPYSRASFQRHDFDLFEYLNGDIGLLWVEESGTSSNIHIQACNKAGSVYSVPNSIIQYKNYGDFYVQSVSIVKKPNNEYTLAMSAINTGIFKPDYDIWALNMNNTFGYDEISCIQVTDTNENEFSPDIDFERESENGLMIIYENSGGSFEECLGMVSSIDGGFNWKEEQFINPIPSNLEPIEHLSEEYIEWKYNGTLSIFPMAYTPSIVCLTGGGFLYDFVFTSPSFVAVDPLITSSIQYKQYGYSMYGFNNESDWMRNNLEDVIDLDVGDTDCDGRREIIVGWQDQVGIYELQSSTDGFGNMTYQEKWLSNLLENKFTGITIYDSNGNGFEELAFSCERGDVFVYDFRDPSQPSVDLLNSQESWNTNIQLVAQQNCLFAADLDGDDKDEFIFGNQDDTMDNITVLDDDGSLIWSKIFRPGTSISRVNDMIIADLDGNGKLDIIVANNEEDHLFVIDGISGGVLWNKSVPYTKSLEIGDFNINGSKELFLGQNSGEIMILNAFGDIIDTLMISTGTIEKMKLGHFTNNSQLSLAVADDNGALRIINITDGSTMYQSEDGIINVQFESRSDIIAHDLDQDGIEEVLFGDEELHILDVTTGIIYYNSTYYGQVGSNIILEDFDGDGALEVLSQTVSNGIYMEDLERGTTIWKYKPNIGDNYDICIGNFGNSDELDVGVIGTDGTIVTIDGRTGMMMWFNFTSADLRACVAVHDSSKQYDSILGWGTNGEIIVYEFVETIPRLKPTTYSTHDLYLDFETNADLIQNFWLQDLDGDGMDEIAIMKEKYDLYLWNSDPKSLWDDPYKSESKIMDVKFGDMNNGEGRLDLILFLQDGTLITLDGDTGEILKTRDPEDGYIIADFAIGDFKIPGDDEIVILYESKDAGDAYLQFYDNQTNKMAEPSPYLGDVGNHMAIGHFSGASTLDVVVGGNNEDLDIFHGVDGTNFRHIDIGDIIKNIKPGYFNGDANEDFAYQDEYGDFILVDNSASPSMIHAFDFELDEVRDFEVDYFYNNDNIAEIVLNLEGIGVVVYDVSGTEVWKYNAPLLMTDFDVEMLIADMGTDNQADLVLTNYNYLQVVNSTSEKLEWNFIGEQRVYRPKLGRFTSKDGVSDIVYIKDNRILIISGMEVAPLKGIASGYGDDISHWYEDVGLFWIPIGITLVIPEFIILKKRRKAKQ